jgi:hypothetical protein
MVGSSGSFAVVAAAVVARVVIELAPRQARVAVEVVVVEAARQRQLGGTSARTSTPSWLRSSDSKLGIAGRGSKLPLGVCGSMAGGVAANVGPSTATRVRVQRRVMRHLR